LRIALDAVQRGIVDPTEAIDFSKRSQDVLDLFCATCGAVACSTAFTVITSVSRCASVAALVGRSASSGEATR
jgi:hypothetical protein